MFQSLQAKIKSNIPIKLQRAVSARSPKNYAKRIYAVCRDVKPENIVLEGGKAGGRVYLVDFGGVQAAAMNQDFGSTIIGVHPYSYLVALHTTPQMPASFI